MACRLRAALDDAAILARIGGDEFCVVLPHCSNAGELEAVARRLIADMHAPLVVGSISCDPA